MESLPNIPIPLRQRWRDFRVAYLPIFTFAALVAAIGWMWLQYVHPAAMVGEVESIRAELVCTLAGTVQEVTVDRLQHVTQGQPLATVAVMDPEVLAAELAAIEAELRLLKARMDVDKTRNQSTLSQMRHDLLQERLNLEVARIRLTQADVEFARVQTLYDQKLISAGVPDVSNNNGASRNDFGRDVAVRDRDTLRSEVELRNRSVEQLEGDLRQLLSTGQVSVEPGDDAVEKAIEAQRLRLRAANRSVVLRSPLTGFVSAVLRRPGQKVVAGQPVLVVSADHSDRVIGWVRQPLGARPKIGDQVQVRPRHLGQEAFTATVVEVGAQLEPVSAYLLPPNQTELGLPFLVQIPPDTRLIPGEAVELELCRRPSPRAD